MKGHRTVQGASMGVAVFGLLVLAGCAGPAGPRGHGSAGHATVREYVKVFRTYPYSDPDPIGSPGRIYPYFRFDGYTNVPVNKEWKVIELENEYLKVLVLPEIGGKIWSAVEKSTGRAFIYDNGVVKFRDIAMRGPWTSGGIEANYGIIGHTPNCATPVDYVTRTDPDGSAVVVIGVLDLLTRTPWRLEVRLPADKAWFSTRSFWHNQTPLEQPYYTWMNAGIKAAGGLQLVYPGTNHVGHDGSASGWPVHPGSGRNLSFYDQNDFGPAKSYHVLGARSEFFGAYWHDDDFGMGRYALRDDKLGKKAWIWGLSRQGMIWEGLLTDDDGQYVEVQSGRLFNQSAAESSLTPFKHRGFEPYQTDTWTEYWFPVKGTRGFVEANDLGALNVERGGGQMTLRFSPLERVNAPVEVLDGERVAFSANLSLAPLETWTAIVRHDVPADRLTVRVGGGRLEFGPPRDDVLSRPLESPEGFDWESPFGLHLKGRELMRQREYVRAQAAIEQCLASDPNFVPALLDLATLRHRALDDKTAFDLARRALAIDTYDPGANYVYGLAAARLGRIADAFDGFEVAAQSPGQRGAAWTELARLYLRRGQGDRAAAYATRATEVNRLNVEALQLLVVTARLRGDQESARRALDSILALDPINHFARFEGWLADGTGARREAFVSGVRNEMPHETFLELAAWYEGLGRIDEALRVLSVSPANAETLYWIAWLQHASGDRAAAAATLGKALAASPRLVFPFRAESVKVLEWASAEQALAWQPKYYLALVWWGLGEVARARLLLDQCGDQPDHAPFYASRARAFAGIEPGRFVREVMRAASIDPNEWRYGRMLAERFLEEGSYDKAVDTARRYLAASPGNYILGMLTARALLASGAARDAASLLSRLEVLPYEGATDGRRLHREAHLLLAVEELGKGRAGLARDHVTAARGWPENLGAGKPYAEDVDERLEDWIEVRSLEAAGRVKEAREMLERLAASTGRPGAGRLVASFALRKAGRAREAAAAFDEWARGERDPVLVNWARHVTSGAAGPLPRASAPNEEIRVLAALAALQR